jgi:hypothetical protein
VGIDDRLRTESERETREKKWRESRGTHMGKVIVGKEKRESME